MSNSSIPSSILFVSSIFLLISISHSANSRIEVVCGRHKPCLNLLKSDPKIVSAKTYKNLALRILESGSNNVTTAQTHLDNLVKNSTKPNVTASLETCRESYTGLINDYGRAHKEVYDDVKDGTADYDLVIAYQGKLQTCIRALDSANITDPTLLSSNYVMPEYANAAIEAIHQIILN